MRNAHLFKMHQTALKKQELENKLKHELIKEDDYGDNIFLTETKTGTYIAFSAPENVLFRYLWYMPCLHFGLDVAFFLQAAVDRWMKMSMDGMKQFLRWSAVQQLAG